MVLELLEVKIRRLKLGDYYGPYMDPDARLPVLKQCCRRIFDRQRIIRTEDNMNVDEWQPLLPCCCNLRLSAARPLGRDAARR